MGGARECGWAVTAHISRARRVGADGACRKIMKALPYIVAVLLAAGCGDSISEPAPPAGAIRFRDITAGYYHTCALDTDGKAWCWGGNSVGSIGDGTRTNRVVPTRVLGNLTFTAIDAGAAHTCALTTNGAAYCWGQNDEGQLGDTTFTVRSEPVAVRGGQRFAALSAGHAHSCALTAAGHAYCWGDNTTGQLGTGSTQNGKLPFPVRVAFDAAFTHVFAGYYQTCALRASRAYCWGLNDYGQNGDDSRTQRAAPAEVVAPALSFTALGLGDRTVCGSSNSTLACWGALVGEQVKSGAPAFVTTPTVVPNAPGFTELYLGNGAGTNSSAENYACGVTSEGRAYCWGGAVRTLRARSAAIVELTSPVRFQKLAPGAQHICGLSRGGYAYCGGGNFSGQLGSGSTADATILQPVIGP